MKYSGRYVAWVLAAFFCIGPFFIYPIFLMKVLCFILFATAFNLLFGYVGLLSFGHAAFFGLGAYVSAHAAKVWGLDPLLCLGVGTAAALALGGIVGLLSIQRQGIYFSMVTLAFAQMLYFLCLQVPFTHGEDGIQGVPRKLLLGMIDLNSMGSLYIFVLLIVTIAMVLLYRIVHSPFGLTLKALRENENRAVALGFESRQYKRVAFMLSAAFAGLAGSLKVFVVQIASLSDVHWHMSGEVVLMALLGGAGVFWGPALGALVLVMLQNTLAEAADWVMVIQGLLFVVCVVLFKRGMLGKLST